MLQAERSAFVAAIVSALEFAQKNANAKSVSELDVFVTAENIAESFIYAGGVLVAKPIVNPIDPEARVRWKAYAGSYNRRFGRTPEPGDVVQYNSIEPGDVVAYPMAIMSLLSDAQEFAEVAGLRIADPAVDRAASKVNDMVNAAKLMLSNMIDAALESEGCGAEGPEEYRCTHHRDGKHMAFGSEPEEEWPIETREPATV